MKVFLAADHGGFAAKEQLKEQLRAHGYEVEDCGAPVFDPNDDYPVYGEKVAEAVRDTHQGRGIAMCRSGHGMVIAANKVPGARAILAVNQDSAVQSREHDDANVLAFGIDYLDHKQILPIALAWLQAEFAGGKHLRRLNEINDLEQRMTERK